MPHVVTTCDLSISPAAAPVISLVFCAAKKGIQRECRTQVSVQGGQTADPTWVWPSLPPSPFLPLWSLKLSLTLTSGLSLGDKLIFIILLKDRHKRNEGELHPVQKNRFLYPMNWKCLMWPRGQMWKPASCSKKNQNESASLASRDCPD